MSLVCLWSPRWRTAGAPLTELAAALLADAPRVTVEARGVLWADARGLPAPKLAWSLTRRLGGGVRAGVSSVPVAAEVAARSGESPVTIVEPGHERSFLAPRSLALLEPNPRLASLLGGVGIEHCGELAGLEQGPVEVRFGPEGVALWRLARADDARLLFRPIPPERAHASLDFVGYEVRSASGLLFGANHLLERLCESLRSRGELARAVLLELPLANRATWRETLRMARPTAERNAWLRRLRDYLDRLVLPDAATGITLRVEATESASARASQGDLFDRGFATASAAEETLARLMDRFDELFVEPDPSAHPLPEERVRWRPRRLEHLFSDPGPSPTDEGVLAPRLELRLLAEPRPVAVRTRPRRDHLLPIAYREGREWRALAAASGPQRVSGGMWHDEGYAREYFRCVSTAGVLLWLYRDAREGSWYLHGWWD